MIEFKENGNRPDWKAILAKGKFEMLLGLMGQSGHKRWTMLFLKRV